MFIRFTSKTSPRVSMFEKDAIQLLAMMQRSGKVPSALAPEDIPRSLEALQHAISESTEQEEGARDDDEESISMKTRAYPLIQLLEHAYEHQEHVLWDYDHSLL